MVMIRLNLEFGKLHLHSHRQRFSARQHTLYYAFRLVRWSLSSTCGVRAAATSDVSDRCNFRGHDPGGSNEQEKTSGNKWKEDGLRRHAENARWFAFACNKTRVLYGKALYSFLPSRTNFNIVFRIVAFLCCAFSRASEIMCAIYACRI